MPTPALVAMVIPPACYEHLSLGGVAQHLLRRPIASHPRVKRTEIDGGLVEELRAKVREQNHTKGEHWEEIVRSYLVLAPRRSNSLGVFLEGLERLRREEGVEPLSEEGAPRLANEELHAMRRERTVARAALDPGVPTRVAAYPY